MNRPKWVALVAATGLMALASSADAATLSVDDDGDECPSAAYSSVQDAVDAADPGDTVTLCEGTYTEGSGAPGTNAVTITKDLTIKGAGADLVTIQPKRSTASGGQIAAGSPVIRDNVGNIVAAVGGSTLADHGQPLRRLGARQRRLLRGRGPLPRRAGDDRALARDRRGHLRGLGSLRPDRRLPLQQLRLGHRARDGRQLHPAGEPDADAHARQDARRPLQPRRRPRLGGDRRHPAADRYRRRRAGRRSESSHIVGRIKCQNFPQDGNCTNPQWLSTGPLFGQDGVRVSGGAALTMEQSLVASNAVNGTNVPTRSTFNAGCTTFTPQSANNANLSLGSGLRFIGADPSSIAQDQHGRQLLRGRQPRGRRHHAERGGPGQRREQLVGLQHLPRLWRSRAADRPRDLARQQPARSTRTRSTARQCPMSTCQLAPAQNSDTVDVCPYRPGPQSDSDNGEFLMSDAPIPVNDAAPSVDALVRYG